MGLPPGSSAGDSEGTGNGILAACKTTVARQHAQVIVHQERDVKAESCDAVCDLLNLLLAVEARVGRVRLDVLHCAIGHCKLLAGASGC